MYKIFYMVLFVVTLSFGFLVSPFLTHANVIIKPSVALGLVGYWPFDNSSISGAAAYDRSGNSNNGTLTGTPTIGVSGKIGQAIGLSGSSQYVSVTNKSPFAFTTNSNFTLSTWVNLNSVSSGSGMGVALLGKYFLGGNFSGYTLRTTTGSNGVTFTSNAATTFTGAITLSSNTWYHIVYVRTSSAQYLYANGVQIGYKGSLDTITDASSSNFNIGFDGQTSGGPTYTNGTIDDVRVYNRALSANEVFVLYNSASGFFKTSIKTPDNKGLIGYWKLDDGAGSYANDASGNGNKGTLINSPTWVNGKIGKALSFNGSNQNVTCGTKTTSIPLTFSVWVKPNSWGTQTALLGYDDISGSGRAGLESQGISNTLTLWFQSTAGNYVAWWVSPPSNGQWTLVTGVIGGTSSGDGIIYYNGIAQSASFHNSGSPSSLTGLCGIGALSENAYYYNGLIDDVRIYKRALSSTEVSNLYNTTNKTATTKLHVLQTPVFSPLAGAVSSGSSVSISVPGGADAIYYTTDGTNPNTVAGGSTSLYTGATTVSTTKVIKAIAVKSGYSKGVVASSKYTMNLGPTDYIARWPLKSNGNDVSGNGHNATFSSGSFDGTEWTADSSSNAAGSVPDSLALHLNDFTYTAWINGTNYWFGRDHGGLGTALEGQRDAFNVWVSGGESHISTIGSPGFVTIVKSGTTLNTYYNGTFYLTGNFPSTLDYSGSYNFAIGDRLVESGNYNGTKWSGTIKDMRVYGRALTGTEISTLYTLGANP